MTRQKLKVAVIHPSVGCVQGGSETFAVDLADRLAEYCDVSLLCQKAVNSRCIELPLLNREKARNSRNPFIRLAYAILKRKATNPDIVVEYLSSIPVIIMHLLLNHYDVLYPHNHWGGLLACNIVRAIKKTPVLYTEHNSENSRTYSRHVKFKPDSYIAHTRHFYDLVKTHYPHINVQYIPNGVNLDKFLPLPKTPHPDIHLKGPVVLAVGEFIERKRLDLAIDAVSRLPHASLLVISFGANLEQLGALGLEKLGPERFQLISDVSHGQMADYYNQCDVFTLPSPKESFGLVYLEAMACNKPVVAPNDETRREIVADAGILCDVENVDAYAAALTQALEQDWGDTPMRQAQKFNGDAVAKRYADEIAGMATRS